jgi:hypothetical protein
VAAVRLWLLQPSSIDIVEPAARRTVASLPAGVLSPDLTRLYSIGKGTAPALQVTDARTGTLLDSVPVDSGLSLVAGFGMGVGSPAGLSPAGRRLVLVGGPQGSDGRLTTSRFRVYDTAALHAAPRAVSLPGNFLFAGIDDAARNLYLTQYTMQPDGDNRVTQRRYDLVGDRLDPNPVPVSNAGAGLIGAGFGSVATADGAWLLTVYAFAPGGPVVEALDLVHATARIIPLPAVTPGEGNGVGELGLLWSLVRSRDGAHIYAVNPALGAVVDITARPPFATRASSVPVASSAPSPLAWWQQLLGAGIAEAKRELIGGAALSPDGRTLYAIADNGIAVIDTATLRLHGTLLSDQPLRSIALSPDGRFLYASVASQSGGLFQVDATTGAVVALPEYGDAQAVLRVTAAG